jgi:hypothetical protein
MTDVDDRRLVIDAEADSIADDVITYYQQNPVDWLEQEADLTVPKNQGDLVRLVADDDTNRIVVVSGNALGKTIGATMAAGWHFSLHWNSLTMATSGNYDILRDTSWRFLKSLHKNAKRAASWPGERKESPPRIEIPDYEQWFLRYLSPRYARNLEGRHARKALVIIEEADKPDITAEHIDSAESTASDAEDTVLVLANPPEDKSNSVYDLLEDDAWTNIYWDWTDSRNVRLDLGELDGDAHDRIPGVVDLAQVKSDWENWNRRPWPGADAAAVAHPDLGGDQYRNLDPRWYRRRMGRMAPTGSATLRPFYEGDVDRAVGRWEDWMAAELTRLEDAGDPDVEQHLRVGVGADMARDGGDRMVVVDRRSDGILNTFADLQPGDHNVSDTVLDAAANAGAIDGWFWIDALGEGSGSADRARKKYAAVRRFQASDKAEEESEFYDRRTEAMYHLGLKLKNDEVIVPPNSDLEDELREAARTLRLEKRSRGSDTVLNLKGKDDLKSSARLGRSPDILDAAALACYEPRPRQNYTEPNVGGVVG